MSETPALSPSIGHVLTTESALHAYTVHRLLGNMPRPVTAPQEGGQLIHAGMLEEWKGVEVLDFDNFRTNAAKEARDAAREAGLIPVLREKYEHAEHTVGRLNARLADLGIKLTGGEAEVSMEWNEPHERGDVLCHGRIDYLNDTGTVIYDVKTTEGSVSPQACANALVNGPGAIQAAAYTSAREKLDPDLAGRIRVIFLFCELREPYAVTPCEPSGSMQELGESRWQRAISEWGTCLADDEWPSHTLGILRVDAPPWALAQELDKEFPI